ncbi:MAG: BMP family ABC transporter substrate-binding protein, partial [Sphaerochaeta sp.]|jgi:basic membrane protein A|nr:BMP family ABC transporter substrate-binding protein [Sphaerochaeta sp.]
MKKRMFGIVLVTMLCLCSGLLFSAGQKQVQDADRPLTVAMVTNQSGLGDQSLNDNTHAGLLKAEKELGVVKKVVESREQSQYVPNLSALADEKCDLVIGVGFMIKDAVAVAAELYPNVNFALVDGEVDLPNVACLLFKEEQGAFLVGVIAAKMTKTNIVGFVGGMSSPSTNKFEVGYRAGVRAVDPDIKVLISYTGTFADPAKGQEQAIPQYAQGADIIFHAAGMTGLGVINAAKSLDKYVIGIDIDQNYLAPDHVITSAIKRVDAAVYSEVKKLVDGTFTGGFQVYGIKEGGMDYADSTSKHCPPEVIAVVESVKARIASGEFTPPATYEELAAFSTLRL